MVKLTENSSLVLRNPCVRAKFLKIRKRNINNIIIYEKIEQKISKNVMIWTDFFDFFFKYL